MVKATIPKARQKLVSVRNKAIAQDKLAGMTYRAMAEKHGISRQRIWQVLSQPEIKDMIDTGTSQMISMIPIACQVQYDTMEDRKENPALALKASELVLKTGGIIPSK